MKINQSELQAIKVLNVINSMAGNAAGVNISRAAFEL